MDWLWKILGALRPSASTDPQVQLAWRWTVAGLLSVIIVGGVASVGWAQGLIPGLDGVATKKDVRDAQDDLNKKIGNFGGRVGSIEKTVNSINLRMIKTDIQTAMADSCISQERGNQEALKRANDDLFGTNSTEGLLDQYQNLAGRPYPVPSCSSILIAPKAGKTGN